MSRERLRALYSVVHTDPNVNEYKNVLLKTNTNALGIIANNSFSADIQKLTVVLQLGLSSI